MKYDLKEIILIKKIESINFRRESPLLTEFFLLIIRKQKTTVFNLNYIKKILLIKYYLLNILNAF